MADKPTKFSLQDIQPDTMRQSIDAFQIASDYAVAKGMRFTGNPYVRSGMLLLLKEARVGIVSAGEAIVEINLTEYQVTKGMIILLPHDTIVNIRSASNDYALNGTVLLPTISVDEPIILHPEDDVHQDTFRIYDTLCTLCQNHPGRKNVIEHLQRAIVDNVCALRTSTLPLQSSQTSSSRGEDIFRMFKLLVSRNARTERKVSFYADQLCVSPHYLMSVIQRVSGQSVMAWVEHAAMLQAKILLTTNKATLSSIAEDMNFPTTTAFCRWFKRIEGFPPGEYKNHTSYIKNHK
ncbi:MAG: AraC family transcriptional regulator [Bacteroidaceae bacterium]|nr:AraC family transcriptional regulator [Bacteroidaceae bacterium]